MLEISTRQFRKEKGESEEDILYNLQSMRGYMAGSFRGFNGDYRADFAIKVI